MTAADPLRDGKYSNCEVVNTWLAGGYRQCPLTGHEGLGQRARRHHDDHLCGHLPGDGRSCGGCTMVMQMPTSISPQWDVPENESPFVELPILVRCTHCPAVMGPFESMVIFDLDGADHTGLCPLCAAGLTGDPVDFHYASGEMVCQRCDRPYWRHSSDRSEPYLRVLCNGERVKL